jgi:hypothetical protein
MNDIARSCSLFGGWGGGGGGGGGGGVVVMQCDVILRIICISNIRRFSTIKKSNFVAPSWGIDFSITTKSSQAKNLPNTEKMSDQRLSSIKLYYSDKMWKFVFNYNKNDFASSESLEKSAYKTFKQFFISEIVFELYAVFDLVPSP